MTDVFRSPEEKAQWESLSHTHADTQRKLKAERQRVRRLLDAAAARLGEAAEPELSYLQAHMRLLESFLRHVQLQDVDGDVWNVPDAATMAALEWETLESTAWLLQMGRLNMAHLKAVLDADLEPAIAGQSPVGPQPAAWAELRPSLSTRGDWADALKRFRMEYAAYEEQAATALNAFDDLRNLPATPDRLTRGKLAGLPATKGAQFRLEALLRRLPEGESFLLGMKLPTPDAPPTAAEVPVRASRKSLTDQVLGFLKKT